MRTVKAWLTQAEKKIKSAKLYFGHGTESGWDEVVYMLLHVLHLPPDTLLAPQLLKQELSEDQEKQLEDLLQKRIEQRIPVAYLTHEAWFAGWPFYVNEQVLIPRSPIAELIEQHFSPWVNVQKVKTVLDIGTGSGCIAIACALTLPHVNVDAVDVSPQALAVAKLNTERYQLTERVHLIESDLFSNLKNKRYDLIISNPPYVAQHEMEALPAEYRHEPSLGLAAGEDGLNIVIPLLQQAAHHLNPAGVLIVEVGNSETALQKHYAHVPFTWLEFQYGGGGVFLLTAQQLEQYFNK